MNTTILRKGAGLAIVGSLMAVISNAVHQRPHDITSFSSHLTETALAKGWILDHLFITLSSVVMFWGLFFIAKSFNKEKSVWSELAIPTAMIATAVSIVFLSVDGYALKVASDLWFNASASDKIFIFPMAQAVDMLDRGLFFVWIITSYGFTPLVYGLSIKSDSPYPKYMGWIAIILGLADFIVGCLMFLNGPTNSMAALGVGIFFLFALWTLAMGIMLWKKSGSGQMENIE